MKRISLIFLTGFILSSPVFSQYEEKDYQIRPVLGLWFGPIAPIPGTQLAPILNTSLTAGLFGRINFPTNNFQIEAGLSYAQLTSDFTASLISVPLYAALVYKLPVDFALSFYFKAGGGAGYFKNQPENHDGILPIFFGGFETSFPAGKFVNIGVRFDYYMIYETWQNAPANVSNFKMINGHIFNVGIMANFSTNP